MLPDRPARFGLLPLFLCGVLLAVFSPVFWLSTRLPAAAQARTYENAALYERVAPSYAYSFSRLRAGEWPLWDPWQLCGTEHLANPRNGIFQPLNLIFLALPDERALAVQGFLCAFVAGMGALLFLRALGARYMPACLGACVYAFGSASAAALSFPDYAAALAWLPLVFWGARAVALGLPRAVPVFGVALALLWLSGALDLFLASAILILAYVAHTSFFGRGPARRATTALPVALGQATLIALGLVAVQLLPYVAWAWQRGAAWPFGPSDLQAALPNTARELVQQLLNVPDDGLLPPLAYLGVVALLVLPGALFHRQARADAMFFLGAGGLGLLLVVYGRAGWDARLAFEAFIFPASFALAVVVGLATDRLFETGRDPRSPHVWGPLLLAAVIGGVIFVLLPSLGRGVAVVFFVAGLVPSVIVRLRWVSAAAVAVAIVLTFIDLSFAMAQHSVHPYADLRSTMIAQDRAVRAVREQVLNGRALVSTRPLDPTLPHNLGALAELRCADALGMPLTPGQGLWWGRLGSLPLETSGAPRNAVVSADAAQPRLLNMMAARAVLASPGAPLLARKWGAEAPRLRPTFAGGGVQVLVNDDALPRAYWVPEWRSVPSVEEALTVLDTADFRPGKECVVQAEGAALEALMRTAPPRAASSAPIDWELVGCTIVGDHPERVELRVSSPASGVTVLADTLAPGWYATVDGAPVPIVRCNGLFRGVPTPAGEHSIVFAYRPWSFRIGLLVSLGTVVVLALWGLYRAVMPARP